MAVTFIGAKTMSNVIRCADGWEITVLGIGRTKNDAGEWVESLADCVWGESLELGYPNGEPLNNDFQSCEVQDYQVYHDVPYEVLWNELARHGFIDDDSPYKPYFLMEWAYKREADRVLELLVKDNKQESRILAREASIDYLEGELSKAERRIHALQAMVKPAIKNPTP